MNYGQLLGFIIHSGVFVSFKFCFGIAYDSNMNKKEKTDLWIEVQNSRMKVRQGQFILN